MATGVNQKKCSLQHSTAHPRNSPPYRRKNLADIFYTSRIIANFVPNFVDIATGVGEGKRQLAAFDGSSSNPPPYRPRCKNLAKNSYASRIIANFVPNFVAMATGVGKRKCDWQHSMAHPRNPPYRPRRKNLAKNLLSKPNYSQFCPKFRCHGNAGRWAKMRLAAFNGSSLKIPL